MKLELPGRKLSKEEVQKLDLPKGDREIALSIFDMEGDVYLIGEDENGYDLSYVLNPKALA